MKLLKTVDEKIADLGFVKMWENEWGARYERQNAQNYIQAVDICHKKSGKHMLFSYDKDRFGENCVGSVGVGLTYKEMRLFLQKMRQMHLQS